MSYYTTQGLMTSADLADMADLYDWSAGQEAVAARDLTEGDTILEDGVDYAIQSVDWMGQTVEVRTEAGTFRYGVDEPVTVAR